MFCSLALGPGLGYVSFTDSGFGAKVDFFGNFYFLPCSDPNVSHRNVRFFYWVI